MANEQQLKVLAEGVEAWNRWKEQQTLDFDLSGADLRRRDLSGIDLVHVNLSDADLSRAELQGVSLVDSNLSGALLFDANLKDARLDGADLTAASLRGANLVSARAINANFTDADMRGANCESSNFTSARLQHAKLDNSRFNSADLDEADLTGASLTFAELSLASFIGANLTNADLTGADLTNALLYNANLYSTVLTNTVLENVGLWATLFNSTDLSTVKGLLSVKHWGPSSIDIDTLFLSGGHIPEKFLVDAGVPDDFVTYVPSLFVQPIQFYSCFISYSHLDEDFAGKLYSRMKVENLRVWYAPEDIRAGKKLYEQVFTAIQMHDKLLLILSENSMQSEWVMTEIRRARKVEIEEKRRKLFPIRLVDYDALKKWECFDPDTGKDLALEVREYYVPDFSEWRDSEVFQVEFSKLLGSLRATN